MEAGGIEPPSRDSEETASTLMSHRLILASRGSGKRDTRETSPGKVSPSSLRVAALRLSCCRDPATRPRRKGRSRAPFYAASA